MAQGFKATVDAWVAETKGRVLAVRNECAQRVIEIMQTPVSRGGALPVDTGFLRASLKAVAGDPHFALTMAPDAGGVFTWDGGEVALVIAGAAITDTISAVYTANYARRLEYGFIGQDSLGRTYNQAGRRFVALAAQQWPRIVSEVVTEAKGRAGK